MKRILCAILLLFLVLGFAGCEKDSGEPIKVYTDKGIKEEETLPEASYNKGGITISLTLKEGWEYDVTDETDTDEFSVNIYRTEDVQNKLRISYLNGFGVCGTGLEQEKIILGEYTAWQGTYDNKKVWDYISLIDTVGDYVIFNECGTEWWNEYGGEAMQILATLSVGGVPETRNIFEYDGEKNDLSELTLEKVIELSQKGEELNWSDFAEYESVDVGSGLYILHYELDETFDLLIGGVPSVEPMYMRLASDTNHNKFVDIRTDDVEAFIEQIRSQTDDDVYKLSSENISSYLVEKLDESYEWGENVIVTVGTVTETNLYLWVNDTRYSPEYSDLEYTVFQFEMPRCDAVLKIEEESVDIPLVPDETSAPQDEPAPCGIDGHYLHDGRNHEKADCLAPHHYDCQDRDHGVAECGIEYHRLCDGITHAPMSCGYDWHCISDGFEHVPAECGVEGHYKCFEQHTPAVCGAEGHLNCDGLVHATRPCKIEGHCYSDGLDHTSVLCGDDVWHYLCDGRVHEKAECGLLWHRTCDGVDHSKCVENNN